MFVFPFIIMVMRALEQIKVVVYVFISKRLYMIAKSYYNARVSLSSLTFLPLGWFAGTFTLVDGYGELRRWNPSSTPGLLLRLR